MTVPPLLEPWKGKTGEPEAEAGNGFAGREETDSRPSLIAPPHYPWRFRALRGLLLAVLACSAFTVGYLLEPIEVERVRDVTASVKSAGEVREQLGPPGSSDCEELKLASPAGFSCEGWLLEDKSVLILAARSDS